MNRRRVLAAILCLASLCASAQEAIGDQKGREPHEENQFPAVALVKTVGNIDVMVDPNVELMNVIQRLAGLPPYVPAKDVPYLTKVDEYFEPYKFSAAVKGLRIHRLAYHLPSEFGMYLKSDDSDFIMKPDNEQFVVSIGQAKNIPCYYFSTVREAVREFRVESKYDRFFLSNTAVYEQLIEKYIQILKTAQFDSWLEDFYGEKQKEKIYLYITRVSGSYGISFVNPKGEIIPHAVVLDQPFADFALYLISHEFSHPMTRQIVVELYKDAAIRSIFNQQYNENASFYNNTGYVNGIFILNETVNQACANKFIERNFSENVMQSLSSWEVESRKMVYVPAITKFLDNYQNNRSKYKTLNDFVPELRKFLATLEEEGRR